MKYFTPQEIAEARLAYADFHGVDYASEVDVTEHTIAGEQGVIGFRLSLDVDGHSHGEDVIYGNWLDGRDHGLPQ